MADQPPITDPRKDSFIEQLSSEHLERAIASMRHLSFFHTQDVLRHNEVRSVHRADAFHPRFQERVETWLITHQMRLGLRGPLPGHPVLGARWGFYDRDSDPSR